VIGNNLIVTLVLTLLSVAGACLGLAYAIVSIVFIDIGLAARRQGRRVEVWSDDATRLRALLQAGASPAIAEQLIRGKKINAIKVCRVETGLGLSEAKQVVNRYERALYHDESRDMRQAR
jgi:hypothetical protein